MAGHGRCTSWAHVGSYTNVSIHVAVSSWLISWVGATSRRPLDSSTTHHTIDKTLTTSVCINTKAIGDHASGGGSSRGESFLEGVPGFWSRDSTVLTASLLKRDSLLVAELFAVCILPPV